MIKTALLVCFFALLAACAPVIAADAPDVKLPNLAMPDKSGELGAEPESDVERGGVRLRTPTSARAGEQ